MLRKLSFLLIAAILFAGCGTEAAMDAAGTAAPKLSTTEGAIIAADAAESVIAECLPAEAETIPDCDVEYFLFNSRSNNVTDDDGHTILIENQIIPSFTSDDPERRAWVEDILAKIDRDYRTDSSNLDTYAREFISMNGIDNFYSHSNYQQLGVARHDERVVSLIVLSSLYSGGTHPSSVQVAYNLDIGSRRILRLEDIITESGAGELRKLVQEKVDEKFAPIDGGNGLFEDYAATIELSLTYGNMTAYWYLNDEGLVIFYNQYELGPYAAGIIKVVLPYEALDGILVPEYLPPEPTGIDGELVILESSDDTHRIPVTIEPAGETLLIGVRGTVYQVQLSEIFWLEDTPISQHILFSAKSLCENDLLEITGGFNDEGRSFAIEYHDGTGESQLVYIRDGVLSSEP